MALASEIFVDKSLLIEKTNRMLGTLQRFVCVSRPRRFGKSMAADMLATYYGNGKDTSELFDDLKISGCESYNKNRNQYDVLKVNMQEFMSATGDMDEMLSVLQQRIIDDLKRQYPEQVMGDNLIFAMQDIYADTGRSFVILIDEWDCLFREYKQDKEAQKKYLDFLRAWLKDKDYVSLAYMTEFFGFTESEVKALCEKYKRNFEETKAWYDGYELVSMDGDIQKNCSMYSPKSVVDAMLSGLFDNYWNQTETYETLKVYI